MDAEYGTVMGYTAGGLTRIPALYNFVADTYAAFDATADFAILNYGSLRQDIPAGDLTKGTVFSLMPFTNTLLKVELPGAQLLDFLAKAGDLGVSGLRREDKNWVVSKRGTPINPGATYNVLMPNFIYETTPSLMAADPSPVMLSDDWRTPVYKWLEKNPTSKDKPLEGLIDGKLRI
jgi:5'-nucleotidase / UDP-sugar diphosphatase